MRILWGILLAAMLFALPARADQIFDVTGSATITGNDVCNGPCMESFNFSLVLDEYQDQFGFYDLMVENPIVNATGPLQPFEGAGIGGGFYVYFNLGGAEIDIPEAYDDSTTPFVPSFADFAELYSCPDQACVAEFSTPGTTSGIGLSGPASVTVTGPASTPEPASLAFLILGLSVFIPLKLRKLLDGPAGPSA